MKEAYVSLEVAKLLKEKGFEIITYMVYDNQGNFDYQNCVCCNVDRMPCLYAPTHQMTCAWLREKYKLHITVDCIDVTEHGYIFTSKIVNMEYLRETKVEDYFYSYEDAMEAAIKYCLENLIK